MYVQTTQKKKRKKKKKKKKKKQRIKKENRKLKKEFQEDLRESWNSRPKCCQENERRAPFPLQKFNFKKFKFFKLGGRCWVC